MISPSPFHSRLSWRGLPLLAVLLLSACSSCARVEPKAASAPAVEDSPRARYIRTTIEIGCMTRTVIEPEQVATRTYALYQRNGFAQARDYLELLETLGQDKSVQQEIQDGLLHCR